MMGRLAIKVTATLPLALLLAGCGDTDEAQGRSLPQERGAAEKAPPAAWPAPGPVVARQPAEAAPARTPPDLRLEVNLAERKLHVYRKGERVATHPAAVEARSGGRRPASGPSAR